MIINFKIFENSKNTEDEVVKLITIIFDLFYEIIEQKPYFLLNPRDVGKTIHRGPSIYDFRLFFWYKENIVFEYILFIKGKSVYINLEWGKSRRLSPPGPNSNYRNKLEESVSHLFFKFYEYLGFFLKKDKISKEINKYKLNHKEINEYMTKLNVDNYETWITAKKYNL